MLDDRKCRIDFGKFIRAGREQRKLYQSHVAKELGITQQYYSQIETGDRNVDFVLALKICDVLDVNINDFIRSCME